MVPHKNADKNVIRMELGHSKLERSALFHRICEAQGWIAQKQCAQLCALGAFPALLKKNEICQGERRRLIDKEKASC